MNELHVGIALGSQGFGTAVSPVDAVLIVTDKVAQVQGGAQAVGGCAEGGNRGRNPDRRNDRGNFSGRERDDVRVRPTVEMLVAYFCHTGDGVGQAVAPIQGVGQVGVEGSGVGHHRLLQRSVGRRERQHRWG